MFPIMYAYVWMCLKAYMLYRENTRHRGHIEFDREIPFEVFNW